MPGKYNYLTVIPAYGRDYLTAKEVRAAWEAGHDFLIQDISSAYDGKYVSSGDDLPKATLIRARYKRLTEVAIFAARVKAN